MTSAISVVIPCHNSETYLGAAIQSVLDQDRAAREIIVVDDGSTDDSRAIASQYPVTRLALPQRSGAGTARNLGVDRASGDLVAFLDADDLWDRNHLAVVGELLERFPPAILAYSAIRLFGARSGTWAPKARPERPFDAFRDLLRHKSQPPQSSAIVRRPALAAAGGYAAELLASEDYGLWLRLARLGPFVCTRAVTASYRWHPTQSSVVHRTVQMAEAHQIRFETVAELQRSGTPDAAALGSMCRSLVRRQLVRLWRDRDRAAALAVVDVARRYGAITLAEQVTWKAAWALAACRRRA